MQCKGISHEGFQMQLASHCLSNLPESAARVGHLITSSSPVRYQACSHDALVLAPPTRHTQGTTLDDVKVVVSAFFIL